MKISQKCCSALLVFGLAGLTGGCEAFKQCSLTYRLWDNGERSFCEPLASPDLVLFEVKSKHDVLVQYSAISDRYDGVLRRSYFLQANQAKIHAGKPPHFVHLKPERDWSAIQINNQLAPTNYLVLTNATASVRGKTFTLYRSGQAPEDFQLPDYRDDHDVWWRAALTPLAVTGDAVIVGSVIGFVAGYCYLQSGAPGINGR